MGEGIIGRVGEKSVCARAKCHRKGPNTRHVCKMSCVWEKEEKKQGRKWGGACRGWGKGGR